MNAFTTTPRQPSIWNVLDSFRDGEDTYDIAKRYGVKESVVANALDSARTLERQLKIFGHKR